MSSGLPTLKCPFAAPAPDFNHEAHTSKYIDHIIGFFFGGNGSFSILHNNCSRIAYLSVQISSVLL